MNFCIFPDLFKIAAVSYMVGCKDKATTWYLNGFPDGSNHGSTHNVGEKPTVTLYTYINRYAGKPNKNKTKEER